MAATGPQMTSHRSTLIVCEADFTKEGGEGRRDIVEPVRAVAVCWLTPNTDHPKLSLGAPQCWSCLGPAIHQMVCLSSR